MINNKILLILGLFLVFCSILFIVCDNQIMDKWWDNPTADSKTSCVVVFNADGGTPAPKAITVAYGVPVGRLRAVSRGTSGFLGWFDDNGRLWDIENQPVTRNDVDNNGILYLTARWTDDTANVIEVIFDTNGSPTGSIDSQYIAVGGKIVQPIVPKAPVGQGFGGWSYNGRLWDFNVPVSDSIASPMVLRAEWTTPYCIIRFEPNGGTRPDAFTTLTHEFAISISYGIVPDPGPLVKDGYYFAGWFTDASNDRWDFTNNRVTATYPASPPNPPVLTLYAKWVPQFRTVIFDQNGGAGVSPNTFILPIGSAVPNPGAPLRTGYTFIGWFHDPACTPGTGLRIADYRIPEPDGETEDEPIYFYAGWITTKLYVEFAIDGHGQVATEYVEYNQLAHNPIIQPPAGKYFDGTWYTTPSCTPGTEWNFNTGRITDNRTLYGKYNDEGWIVTFVLGNSPTVPSGFTTPSAQHIPTGGKVIEPFMPPLSAPALGDNETRNSFYGWSLSPIVPGGTSPSNVVLYNFDTPVTSNITLYARWVEPVPDMVWVPRGAFIMGDAGISGTPAAYHAYPTRRVTVDGFYISRYMITQEDGYPLRQTGTGYNQITGRSPSQFTGIRTRPVENVSWYDAMEYCNMRSAREGLSYPPSYNTATMSWETTGYRLPTEAEWEYAARGGLYWTDNFVFAGSNNADEVAWYNITVKNEDFKTTQTVGRKAPNRLGIYDMSGNLSEWCYDWFAPYSSLKAEGPNGTGPNPIGPASGSEKVRRGGAWNNAAGNVRVPVRNSEDPTAAHWAVGFRVVRGARVVF